MNKSDSIAKLCLALSKAQAEMPAIPFDSTNPFLKNRYASLGAVIEHSRPVLAKFGLAVVQMPIHDAQWVGIETVLTHESGEWMSERIGIELGEEKGKSRAQVAGSIITYLRRYSWAASLGLYADEDTDGNEPERKSPATAREARSAPARSTPATPPPRATTPAPTASERQRQAAPPREAPAPRQPAARQTKAQKEAAEEAENKRRLVKWLGMVDTASGGNVAAADQVFVEMGILLETESYADGFPMQHIPATQAEADALLHQIAERAGVDYLPGAIPSTPAPTEAPARRETAPPQTETLDQYEFVEGYIKRVMTKPTAKGNTKYSILVVEDEADTQGGWWISSFDTKDGELAESLKGDGGWHRLHYTEGNFGKDLVKHGIVPNIR